MNYDRASLNRLDLTTGISGEPGDRPDRTAPGSQVPGTVHDHQLDHHTWRTATNIDGLGRIPPWATRYHAAAHERWRTVYVKFVNSRLRVRFLSSAPARPNRYRCGRRVGEDSDAVSHERSEVGQPRFGVRSAVVRTKSLACRGRTTSVSARSVGRPAPCISRAWPARLQDGRPAWRLIVSSAGSMSKGFGMYSTAPQVVRAVVTASSLAAVTRMIGACPPRSR